MRKSVKQPSTTTKQSSAMASGTGLIYDEQMTDYKLLWNYPACRFEIPERLTSPYEKLKHYGLVERCFPLPIREAVEEEILLVHSLDYLEAVKSTPSMNVEDLKTFSNNYNDVYFHSNSYHCAKLSLGGTLQLVDAVMLDKVRNGIALVRPPGHHSEESEACGFCIFNNVAIAAEYAKKKYGTTRILIVDWDVHHGQGIQHHFEEDPSVLYFSWHRYEHQQYWPNLKESDYDAVGKGKGTGFNINVPWNKIGMENSDYLAAFFHILLPMAYEFNPELILVSAGFDSAIGDPEGEMGATPECFAHLTHLLKSLANGKICVVLEGGYNLRSLSESVCMTVRSLLGDPVPQLVSQMAPCISAIETIQNVRAVHQKHWNYLKYQDSDFVKQPSTKKVKPGNQRNPAEPADQTASGDAKSVEGKETNADKDFDDFMDSHMKKVLVSAPPVRTALAGLEVKISKLDQCLQLEGKKITIEEVSLLTRINDPANMEDENFLPSLGKMFALIDKITRKEVRNGIVVSATLSPSVFAAQYSTTVGLNRVLLLLLGELDIPIDIKDNESILVVQICRKLGEKMQTSHYIPICWKENGRRDGDLLYALLQFILPLAYGHQPDLVILAVESNSDIQVVTLTHLTHLLQGLSEGRILAIFQDSDVGLMEAMVNSLLGDPVTPVASFVHKQERVLVLEKLRHELWKHWKLLQNRVQ